MSWKEHYAARSVSGLEAVSKINDGDRVVVSHAVSEPSYILDVMADNYQLFHDVEIVHMVGMGKLRYCEKEMEGHFRHNAFFLGGIARNAVAEGRGDFTPCYFSEIPELFYTGTMPVDVFVLQVSPPDEHGYCSMGIGVDYGKAAFECARMVIVQVNENMPRTHGDTFISVTDIDYFVRHTEPVIELKPATLTDVDLAIGKHCASLIKDGDTLQLGIGSLPDAVLCSLKDKNDLGIHSELISDSVVDLMVRGNINNKKKTLHKDKAVGIFIMGTRKLYDFVDDNPVFNILPAEYVNNPTVIAQNDNMISINSCVQVDFMGQVCAEMVGTKQISGVGGQVDFVRGANMSRGGKAIIAMHSTARGGSISKIVPFLDHGAAVTTTRNDVRYVVTEYGVAYLWGKTLRDRARALIEIAHPNFRDELKAEWEKRFMADYQEVLV